MKRKWLAVGIILLFNVVANPLGTDAKMPIASEEANTISASIIPTNNGTLSGYVTDTAMNPIEGARVRVYFHNTSRENYSDATGYYHVTDIPICNCTKNATCSKEGYYTAWIYLSIWENTTYNFTLIEKGHWFYVGGSGPGNYTRIQDAVDNASDGDTVFVYNGTYYEVLVVNKTIDLIGEDRNITVIDGGWGTYVVDVSSDGVTISGFTIQNGVYGIRLVSSSNNTIMGNTATSNNYYGIVLDSSSNNNIIMGNTASNNYRGIILWSSSNNIVTGNNVSNNYRGIILWSSSTNIVTGNNVSNNRYGITLWDSSNNIVTGNNVSSNEGGIVLDSSSNNNTVTGNNVSNNSYGITLWSSSNNNIIEGNNASNNGNGIRLDYSSNNTISGNNASNNDFAGIELLQSHSNIIVDNHITNNYYGINLSGSNNIVQKNNFLNNEQDAYFLYDGISDALFQRSRWKQNYWNRPRILPKLIFGEIKIDYYNKIHWFNIDWRPALNPYDIP